MVVLMDPGEDPEDTLRTHRSREKTFIFDTVFDQHASQVPSAHCPLVPLGQAVLTVLTKPCRPLGGLCGQMVSSIAHHRGFPDDQG